MLAGAFSQILATGLMLSAMRQRSFAVVTAYTKTEPVQVAIFGLLLLGDHITILMAAAIVIATAGVLVMSVKPGTDSAECGVEAGRFRDCVRSFFRPCGDRVSGRDPVP